MPDASQSVPFDVALRGYDRDQVDAHLASLESEFTGALGERDRLAERVKQLESRVEELHLHPGDESDEQPAAPLSGFGVRIEKIMRVAADEAAAVREEAAEEMQRERAEA
jgi:DivIVA domain-containing protein